MVVEDWTEHAPRTRGAVTTLDAGRAYDIVLEYYERGGGAELRFSSAFVGNSAADVVQAAREADAVVFSQPSTHLRPTRRRTSPSWRSPTIKRRSSTRC